MELYASGPSPYARKVRVALHEYGLTGVVEEIMVDIHSRPAEVLKINGLAKIPVLELDDGPVLFDSPVILQYLDETYPDKPSLVPAEGPLRWHVLRHAALADGVMDSAVAVVMEKRRPPEGQHRPAIEREVERLHIALDMMEREAGGLVDGPRLDTIGFGVALEYLDLRLQDEFDWRAKRSDLEAWMRVFCQRDSMLATRPG